MEQIRYLIGLATLAVVVISGWLVVDLLSDDELEGRFRLKLQFEDARGLRGGGDLRYRGVRVGQVVDVSVDSTGERALVEVVFDEVGAQFARTSSQFWIVSPRFDGLTAGATGLDTLVRDTYVAFLTPDPDGPALAPGGVVIGREKPLIDPDAIGLEPIRHGDLQMTLHAAENHGIRVGTLVRYRGITTGDVRQIQLAEDGSHVVISLRIAQRYRKTVTDRSAFWVGRPRLSGALMSGIAIEDLNALLTPYVGYHSESESGVPVPDGFRAVALDARPEIEEESIRLPAAPDPGATVATDTNRIRLVHIDYEAVEKDWLSANDTVNVDSTGVLFVDSQGRAIVVTTRTACDAAYFMRDSFGMDPDIDQETIRVTIPGGTVLQAGRAWVDPDGKDLAVLVLGQAPSDLPGTESAAVAFDFDPAATDAATEVGVRDSANVVGTTKIGSLPAIAATRGRAITVDERVVGLLGQATGTDTKTVIIPMSRLPEELRPVR